MPVLANSRHELFAQAIVKGTGPRDAYRAAGFNSQKDATIDAAASRLLVMVKDRVDELKGAAADDAGLTRAWVLDRLMANAEIALGNQRVKLVIRKKAKAADDAAKTDDAALTTEIEVNDRDANAANRALELLGKEIGLFVETTENRNVTYAVADKPPTREEWEAEHADSATAH